MRNVVDTFVFFGVEIDDTTLLASIFFDMMLVTVADFLP